MSAVRKLVIASALVATGLGVAFLLGKPGGIQKVFHPAVTLANKPESALITPAAKPQTEMALASVHAQLFPESTNLPKTSDSAPEPPALISSLVPVVTPNDEPAARDAMVGTANVNSLAPRAFESNTPIAKLRNEAPRAIGNEPRTVAVIRRLPPVDSMSNALAIGVPDRANVASGAGSQSLFEATSFSPDSGAAPATVAAFDSPTAGGQSCMVAPPPWPVSDEAQESRTHVVVDGDSLQNLAGRYLDNPQRSQEIFELNRDVLANPELLPIGAELRIPERFARSSWNRQGYRPAAVDDTTIRSAANGNLVPIRAATAADPYDVTAPRAQLAHPIAVE